MEIEKPMKANRVLQLSLGLLAFGLASPASATDVKFTLDWAFQGPQAPHLLALERGYFKEEGLNVTIDRGFGSGDVPVKLLGGAYEIGVADLNPTIRLKLEKPDADIVAVGILGDATALAVMTTKRQGITKPSDLVGKTLAAPETDAGRQLFPAFARAVGLDLGAVKWQTVTPQLRETMLAQGQVNAITGFTTSGILSLKALGVADSDMVVMKYDQFGVDLYSTSILVRKSYAEANPKVVQGMVKGILRGFLAARAEPAAAIAALKKRDSLIDEKIETERMLMQLNELSFTPWVLANGFGRAQPERIAKSIETVRAAFNVPTTLAAGDIYSEAYLPPVASLQVPK